MGTNLRRLQRPFGASTDGAADRAIPTPARGQRLLGRGLQSFMCLFALIAGVNILSGSTLTLMHAPPAVEVRPKSNASVASAREDIVTPLAAEPEPGATTILTTHFLCQGGESYKVWRRH